MAGKVVIIQLILSVFLFGALLFPAACPGLAQPVPGEVLRPYEPVGRYGGHWGGDFAAAIGVANKAMELV